MSAADYIKDEPDNIDDQVSESKDVNHLETEVVYRTKLQEISNAIYAAFDLNEILMDFKQDMTELVGAQRITIYYVDSVRRELVSRFKSGTEISEIRIPVNKNSIAGYCAVGLKILNIKNVYDNDELYSIDPGLKFDATWDSRSGYETRQVLVSPILFNSSVLGVIQLINRRDGASFTGEDETNVEELAKILGIAIYKQKKMASSLKSRFDYLLESHLIARSELNDAIVMARKENKTVETIFLQDLHIPKKEIGESLSRYYEVPYVEYQDYMPLPEDLLDDLDFSFLRKNNWVPVSVESDAILVAIDNPDDMKRIDDIKTFFPNHKLKFGVALARDIEDIIRHFTHRETNPEFFVDNMPRLKLEGRKREKESSVTANENKAIAESINKMIIAGYERGASDIHIEPYPGRHDIQVRMRVGGSCSAYQPIPHTYREGVVDFLKTMANLDITERQKPQDGNIRFENPGGRDIDLRVTIIPTQGGLEDVVLHLFDTGHFLPLEKTGLSSYNHEKFINAISSPHGLILVCGPAGSGKTTTLHSVLAYIKTVDKKIWTAENPVEITQPGLRQVQVKPEAGHDFANAMSAFLRADPDVIMIGNMQDYETGRMSVEASLSGALVLSALHTNAAPETVSRLLDMGIDRFNLADSLVCIMAQRLVRTLCHACRYEYSLSKKDFDKIVREYGAESFKRDMKISYSKNLTLFASRGCSACSNLGYQGRTALHELLVVSDAIKLAIHNRVAMAEIRDIAINEGMTTLKQDGIAKAFSGICDLAEVRKACIK